MVFPFSFSFKSESITIFLLCGSKEPVGSSANTMRQGFNNKRAMAMRCCSPPEHLNTFLFSKPDKPTSSKAFEINPCLFFFFAIF